MSKRKYNKQIMCRITEAQARELPSRAVRAGHVRGDGQVDVSAYVRACVFDDVKPFATAVLPGTRRKLRTLRDEMIRITQALDQQIELAGDEQVPIVNHEDSE